MPDYRRFIAYFYEYIDGKKQKNAGFAKVELRNGMWRILFRLMTEHHPEPPVQVYGFVRQQGWLLGMLMGTMRSGSMMMEEWAYQAETPVWRQKYGLEDLSGIWIQSGDGRFYVTVWDDEPVDTGKFVLELPKLEAEPEAEAVSQAAQQEGRDAEEHALAAAEDEAEQPVLAAAEDEAEQPVLAVSDNEVEQLVLAVSKDEAEQPVPAVSDDEVEQPVLSAAEDEAEQPALAVSDDEVEQPAAVKASGGISEGFSAEFQKGAQMESEESELQGRQEAAAELECVSAAETDRLKPNEAASGSILGHSESFAKQQFAERPAPQPSWDTGKSPAVIRQELRFQNSRQNLRNDLFRRRQHFEPFEDLQFSNCIQIMPCDLIRLQQAGWQVGRSTFLLHGFYQYHHLLFGMAADGGYVLGVPGIPGAQERYMAQMFGFGKFKTAKWNDRGRQFGYWYRILPE